MGYSLLDKPISRGDTPYRSFHIVEHSEAVPEPGPTHTPIVSKVALFAPVPVKPHGWSTVDAQNRQSITDHRSQITDRKKEEKLFLSFSLSFSLSLSLSFSLSLSHHAALQSSRWASWGAWRRRGKLKQGAACASVPVMGWAQITTFLTELTGAGLTKRSMPSVPRT